MKKLKFKHKKIHIHKQYDKQENMKLIMEELILQKSLLIISTSNIAINSAAQKKCLIFWGL